MKRAYRGRILTPITTASSGGGSARPGPLCYFEDGLLVIGSDGRIAAVAAFDERAAVGPVTDLRPSVLVPGFVDAHLHYPQARIIGSASGPLLQWLDRSVFPEEGRFRDEAYASSVAGELVTRLVESGTTTACFFSSSSLTATEVLFRTLAGSGLRAVAGLALMDQACPEELRTPREQAIAACLELTERWHGYDGGRLGVAVTPRFALGCSRALLEDVAALAAEHALFVQTHVAESLAEEAATRSAHPWASSSLDACEKVGLLGPRTLLTHAVQLGAQQWDRVAALGARVVHCPDSNFFLGSGRMRLADALARGVPVALGTDVGAGRSFSIRRAMASAYDSALCVGQPVSPEAAFTLATLGGARALGLDAVVGSLEVGKEADVAVFCLPSHVHTAAQVLAHLVFANDDVRAERVLVRGRKLRASAPSQVPPPPTSLRSSA